MAQRGTIAADDFDLTVPVVAADISAEADVPPSQTVTVEDLVDDDTLDLNPDGWNGNHTRLAIAFPIIRNNVAVKPGTKVVFEASFSGGRWRGPEAEHVMDLLMRGYLEGPSANERRRRQAVIDTERGAFSDPSDPQHVAVPGIQAPTWEQFEAMHASLLRGGPEAMAKREKREVASEVAELKSAMTGFAQTVSDTLAGMQQMLQQKDK